MVDQPEKPGIVALCNAIQNYLFDLTVVFGAATSRQPPDANNTRTAADAAPNSGQARNENRDW